MRSRLIAVAVLVSLLTGCATVREVDLDSGGSQIAEINAAARRKSISVELISGWTRSGLKLDIGPDTTCWIEGGRRWIGAGDEERVCVPTSEVRKITVQRQLKGCLQGGGIGLGIGFAAVAVPLGALLWGSDDGLVAVVVIYYAGLGGAIGTLVGAVMGMGRGQDVYILNP